MWVVAREEVELVVRLGDEIADVFVDEGREGELRGDLLRGLALELRELGLGLPPDLRAPVEPLEHRRHPAGPELDGASAQPREALEHTVEH